MYIILFYNCYIIKFFICTIFIFCRDGGLPLTPNLLPREKGNGSWRWFAVDFKFFEFLLEGEGKKTKVFIAERSKGRVSSIRF